MDRYFYQDMVVPYDIGLNEYRVFDRTRGCSEGEYALAVCTDPDVAQRICALLNADAESQRVYKILQAREALGDEIVEPDTFVNYEVETYQLKEPRE